MGPSKAARTDGFSTLFFQSQWEVVGESVVRFVQQAFNSGNFPPNLNSTLLVLIPKVMNLENIIQFRPISLCNVAYKILTKVLSNRMKLVMSSLIGQGQTSFVAGRNIVDSIIIAQELAHSIRNKKSQWCIAIKIDLHKACDKLRWEFIEYSLRDAGFPEEFIKIFMFYLALHPCKSYGMDAGLRNSRL